MFAFTTRTTPAENCSRLRRELCFFSHSEVMRRARSRSSVNSPPRKRFGPQPPHQQIGIGHGGLNSAAVADWTGIGAGGFRTHAQQATSIEARKRSAAGADGVNLEHGNSDGQAGHFRLASSLNRALNCGHVGRSTSHVEGQNFCEAAAGRSCCGADQSTGGTG